MNKGKSAIPHLCNAPELLTLAFYKANLFREIYSKNSNLDHSGVSLPVFIPRTNPKLHIPLTPKLVKKVIKEHCIPLVVLNNREAEPSCILAELFIMCLKEFCFPDCLKV